MTPETTPEPSTNRRFHLSIAIIVLGWALNPAAHAPDAGLTDTEPVVKICAFLGTQQASSESSEERPPAA